MYRGGLVIMDLATEAIETIKELKKQGLTIDVINWVDYIQNKAAEIYKKRSESLDIFPALIIDECMLAAQECFAEDKARGLLDENNCYVGE